MIFRGYSRTFSTEGDAQYRTIGAFWDDMSARFGRESLRGLGYNWTPDTIEYVIGRKDNGNMALEAVGNGAVWKEIALPDAGWATYRGMTSELGRLYADIYSGGALTYEIEQFNDDGSCLIAVTREG